MGTLTIHRDLQQGTDEWLAARCGMVTASVIGALITTKTLKPASNDYQRSLTASLVAERLTGRIEEVYMSADMERGIIDEPFAIEAYEAHTGTSVEQVGFMTRELDYGTVGYSPDGLVDDDGLVEVKSRRPKKHVQTVLADAVPIENMAQIQTGFFVSGRSWCDYISYAGGMHLWTKRVLPDPKWQEAIDSTLRIFETNAAEMTARYHKGIDGMPLTERLEDLVLSL